MLALYRKYRPQRFAEVFGQTHIKETLRVEVKTGRVAHAYVFTGPRGTGKTSTARILAAALNCERAQEGEPCTKCLNCKSIQSGTWLDLIEIDAASQTGVDHVRANIIETSRFTPQLGSFRIYIIDEAHMLSSAAWNALLKTLEEPPTHVIFILATTEGRKIPDTILSRCQHFTFKPLDHDTLKERLAFILRQEKVDADDAVINEIATRSQGFVRDAESLLGQCLAVGHRTLTLEKVKGVLEKSPVDALITIARAVLAGDAMSAFNVLNDLKTRENQDILFHDFVDVLRAAHYYRLTGTGHPQFARRHGKGGLDLIRELADSDKIPLSLWRAAFTAGVERLSLLRSVPADLCFELVISEIAALASKSAPTPSRLGRDTPPGEGTPIDSPLEGGLKASQDPSRKDGGVLSTASDAKIKVKSESKPASTVTLDAIQKVWHTVLARAQEQNRALPSILKFARLLKVESANVVHIGLPHRFHIECLQERNLSTLIEGVLGACLGSPVRLAFALITAEAVESESNQTLNRALDMFGGKLVEE